MWPRRSQQGNGNWVSVVLFPGRICIAEVRREPGSRPAVGAWESIAVDGPELEALKLLRQRLQGHRCVTLLHAGEYQLVQIEAPQVPIEERRNAVRWRIKEMVNFPVEEAGVDVVDIPAAQGGSARGPQLFAVAASHQILAPRIHLFQDARLPLAAIDIPELAQRNIASLFEDENRGLALLAFDESGGLLTFTYRGELYASRRIDVGVKELAAPGGDGFGGVFERVLLDVQRSLDNFDRNYSFITLARLLVAPIPGAAAFVEYLKGNLYQPVELLDFAKGIDVTGVSGLHKPEQQADALLAIGAAMRGDPA